MLTRSTWGDTRTRWSKEKGRRGCAEGGRGRLEGVPHSITLPEGSDTMRTKEHPLDLASGTFQADVKTTFCRAEARVRGLCTKEAGGHGRFW